MSAYIHRHCPRGMESSKEQYLPLAAKLQSYHSINSQI
jgi:hypothetical protein